MEKRTIRVVKLREAVGKNKNKELDETIIQTCKWIQKKLQISDKSIRDEKSSGNDECPGGAGERQK